MMEARFKKDGKIFTGRLAKILVDRKIAKKINKKKGNDILDSQENNTNTKKQSAAKTKPGN